MFRTDYARLLSEQILKKEQVIHLGQSATQLKASQVRPVRLSLCTPGTIEEPLDG